MDEKGIGGSCLIVSETKVNSFCPMYFGVSCAFFALKVVSGSDKEDEKWFELCDKMLQGSAQLLGLLVWRIQKEGEHSRKYELLRKLEIAEKEIKDLKQIRREDAKANEKVVGIFASQEQSWFTERKRLRQEIGALMNELRVHQKRKEETISQINDKLKEMEMLIESKDKGLKEEECKRKVLEEKLSNAENVAEELRQNAKREAQEYSTDLWKHKTAFLELVSNQRQLEAELGRAFRQLEAKRQEIEVVLEKKEESVLLAQKLSLEIVKMRNDLEQKDKILSAMLRKCKLETAEKQMLLKEVKLSKAKKKLAEVETERWRTASESKHQRNSLRNMFTRPNSRADDPSIARGSSQIVKSRSQPPDYVLEYDNPEFRNDALALTPLSGYYSPEINGELAITANVKRLEGWVHAEAEKYSDTIEKRHQSEIDAFAEQMRLKDEKLEAFRWRMLSMEIESKRLLCRVESLNKDMSELRNENMKLETLLFHSREAFNALKEQLTFQVRPKADSYVSVDNDVPVDKIVDIQSAEKNEETKGELLQMSQQKDPEEEEADPAKEDLEFEEEKNVLAKASTNETSAIPVNVDIVNKSPSPDQPLIKTSNSLLWRMDLQALGVSYKIKRLKQQLLMLERLTGKRESTEQTESNGDSQKEVKGFDLLMCLLNKQISRYQSLQSKIDELCKRMHDNDHQVDKSHGDSSSLRTKGERQTLEHFLEETFQLQRYMVATGQKLMEVQSKIASGLVGVPEELDKSVSFDTNRFAENVRSLFQEVQRGLEVRIARIIGDLGGTLTCEGMIRMRK